MIDEDFPFGKAAMYIVLGVVFLIVVVGMGSLLWGEFRPALLDQEHEANIHSHQYVEARRTEILNNVGECRRLNTRIATLLDEGGHEGAVQAMQSQRAAIAARISIAVVQIPQDGRSIDFSACQ